jgi:hypothetical protein
MDPFELASVTEPVTGAYEMQGLMESLVLFPFLSSSRHLGLSMKGILGGMFEWRKRK